MHQELGTFQVNCIDMWFRIYRACRPKSQLP